MASNGMLLFSSSFQCIHLDTCIFKLAIWIKMFLHRLTAIILLQTSQCSKWKISRNGTLVKILKHSEEKFMFSSYNQSRRIGTLIPLHLTNRNGVPVSSGPFRALRLAGEQLATCSVKKGY